MLDTCGRKRDGGSWVAAEWTRLARPWAAWTASLAGAGNGAGAVRGETAGTEGDRRGDGGALASVRLVLARSMAMTTSCGGVGPRGRLASPESVACRLRFLLPAPNASTCTGGGDGGPPDDAAEDMDDEREDLPGQPRR